MENASKALIMAAGVLIGIMILSLAVYLFATFGATSAEAHRQNEQNRINQFNTQFTSYEGKSDITIYDVITLANLAKNSNEYYGLTSSTDSNYYITVNANLQSGFKAGLEKYTDEQFQQLIISEMNNLEDQTDPETGGTTKALHRYQCTVTINQNTQLVKTVNFN